jgi:hypothetical protein
VGLRPTASSALNEVRVGEFWYPGTFKCNSGELFSDVNAFIYPELG